MESTSTTPDSPACLPGTCGCSDARPRRRGLRLGLLAGACGAACLLVPLAAAGSAALTGVITGELLAGVGIAAAVLGAAFLIRRRSGRGC